MGNESYTPDRLFAGDFPVVTREVTILTGEAVSLSRGAVLGKITSGGKYALVDSTANDGSETAVAVLAEDVDATEADVVAVAYESGDFNEDELTFGGTDTIATHREAMHARSLFTHAPLDAAGIDD
ncbi:head decoration protein [bacterium]|nr:head decoration protein [bacterium]